MEVKIVQAGDPVLRRTAKPLAPRGVKAKETRQLIEAMRAAMYEAPGVGLAAPQIGFALQIAVIEDKPEYVKDVRAEVLRERERSPVPFHAIINPKITLWEDEAQPEFFEGCLSLTGFTAVVPRARRVTVECLDHKGEAKTIQASGWYARILQHEIDHLRGSLYIDRMRPRTFMGMENFNRHWKDRSVAEVLRILEEK